MRTSLPAECDIVSDRFVGLTDLLVELIQSKQALSVACSHYGPFTWE